MLKHLKKEFSKIFNGSEDLQHEEVEMTEIEKATLAAAENKAAELTVALETANTAFADATKQVAELTAKYEAAQAALNASEAAQKELAIQAAEKRLTARTEAIKLAVGDGKVDALLAATDGMADEQFNVIVNAMAASFDAEAKTPAFTEQGAAAEAKAEKTVTHFNEFIDKESN